MERRTADEMKHQGRLAIRVMRAYQSWRTRADEDLHAVKRGR